MGPSFEQLADGLDGASGVVIWDGKGWVHDSWRLASVHGDLTSGSAWSTIKVPIALCVLEDLAEPNRLSDSQREAMAASLTLSDNEATALLFADLMQNAGGLEEASAAVELVLRKGGDHETKVSTLGRDGFSTYGQTDWSLGAQVGFMAGLLRGELASPQSTSHVLGLMGQVTSDMWGLGSIGQPALWKGGWGPDTDGKHLLRQMGVVDPGGENRVVAFAVKAEDGTFETGQLMATRVAEWLAAKP